MSLGRFRHDVAGVSSVEFAFLSPIFILLTFGAIDAGELVWTQITLEHAVESAARCAALRSSNCLTASNIQAYAAAQAPGLSVSSSAFAYATPSCGAQLTASYTYRFFSAAFPTSSMMLTAASCLPFASAL